MKVLDLPSSPEPSFYHRVVSVLKKGGIVALPTDTSYTLAIDLRNPRLSSLKPPEEPPVLFLNGPAQIEEYAVVRYRSARRLIGSPMPGGLTVILDASPKSPVRAEDGSVGVRVPKSEWLSRLVEEAGGVAATGAHRSPHEIARSLKEVDLIVDGGVLDSQPSTVLDLRRYPFSVRQKGVVPILEIDRVLGRRVKMSPDLYFSILLVCTGNLCRSPIAQGILTQKLSGYPVLVRSAGTDAVSGEPPTQSAIRAAASYGADISRHRSTPLSRELIEEADLILVMAQHHYERVLELIPQARVKTRGLRSYRREGGILEVPDPMGGPYSMYEKTARICERALRRVARDVKLRYPQIQLT